jgi:hypothetical protein
MSLFARWLIMIKDAASHAVKMVLGVVALAVAVVLVWRGNTYGDGAQGTTFLIPAMCTLTAVIVTMTVLAAVLHRPEHEQPA